MKMINNTMENIIEISQLLVYSHNKTKHSQPQLKRIQVNKL